MGMLNFQQLLFQSLADLLLKKHLLLTMLKTHSDPKVLILSSFLYFFFFFVFCFFVYCILHQVKAQNLTI